MQYVDDVLNVKGRAVYTATPTTTVFEALELMADKEVGALVVVEKDRLVGIFSERDYARRSSVTYLIVTLVVFGLRKFPIN